MEFPEPSDKEMRALCLDTERCDEEQKAVRENRMVVCTAGRTKCAMKAVLLELRRRGETTERWVDLKDAITGRKRRPSGGRVPGLMRVIKVRELKEVVEVGLGGMQLRGRELPKPKKHILKLGSRAVRLPRGTRGKLRYQSTIFPGLSRDHAVRIIKGLLSRGARRAASGEMSVRRMQRLSVILDAWESSVGRSSALA